MIDFTAPARRRALLDSQTNLPDLELPAPMLPGHERIDVYLAQRGWNIQPRDVEVRDMVLNPQTGEYGWAVFNGPEDSTYHGAEFVGFLRANEQPSMVVNFPNSALHIRVLPS